MNEYNSGDGNNDQYYGSKYHKPAQVTETVFMNEPPSFIAHFFISDM
jgi:hypothetical protein